MMPEVQAYVQENHCSGCGICLDSCPFEAIDIVDGKACVIGECLGCMECASVCPEQAIVSTQGHYKQQKQDPWSLYALRSGRRWR